MSIDDEQALARQAADVAKQDAIEDEMRRLEQGGSQQDEPDVTGLAVSCVLALSGLGLLIWLLWVFFELLAGNELRRCLEKF
jgi:hypothetical protein